MSEVFFIGPETEIPLSLGHKRLRIKGQYWYFAQVNDKWRDEIDASLLATLLIATPFSGQLPENRNIWLVPRLGTISPWSSKATDIVQNCNFSSLIRLERGVCYHTVDIENLGIQNYRQLFDPLTESLITDFEQLKSIFTPLTPKPLKAIDLIEKGISALEEINQSLGLALNPQEISYLNESYTRLKRNPTDVELMMFAQVNSEHCRHKIFNAYWQIDGNSQNNSLFNMIRHTHQCNPDKVLVAYEDNAAVIKGPSATRWMINPEKIYTAVNEDMPIVFKVETHNHPTAISPFPGAATGSGGEIRDETATGRGASPKAGFSGFSVSNLYIPEFIQPWEIPIDYPPGVASALDIMLQAPIGAARFNNEFGRPGIAGYFRTFFQSVGSEQGKSFRGYHKPIMIAGGIGAIRPSQVYKQPLPVGALLIVLGGPAMAIGLGGGSASSRSSGENTESLDFSSVQRANAEMQRRCQEVINACWSLGEANPMLSIHDVGAGGLANALPELVAANQKGALVNLRAIPNAAPGMTPLEIWCNESQERYVLAILPENSELFSSMARRERCPFAMVGEVIDKPEFMVFDPHFNNMPVNLPLSLLFEKLPRMQCSSNHVSYATNYFKTADIPIEEAVRRVLQFPCVGSKSFLITIADRTVSGLVSRDPMVGAWQVPVADVAVTCTDYQGYLGEALSIGERPPIALVHHAASARMAVGEAITNIAGACINDIKDIVLSANWMASPETPGEGAGLYDAVQAIGMELCPALGISIPVGKDSLSMRTVWESNGKVNKVSAPLSLIVTATASVTNIKATLTPELQTNFGPTRLIVLDLGEGCNCMAGSVLEQAYNILSQRPPDLDDPSLLKRFFQAIQTLNLQGFILAYHDRSDGGLLATLCEMMFAGHVGINISLDDLISEESGKDAIAVLFTEELGAVIQVRERDVLAVMAVLQSFQLTECARVIGELNQKDELHIECHEQTIYCQSRVQLQRWWAETSYRLQSMRDDPECAQEEYDNILDTADPGLTLKLNFDLKTETPSIKEQSKPRVAILREQGVNGHMELAAAFSRAGFDCFDVHMSDIFSGRIHLVDFVGIAAGGGFSYGDVLGAGRGWAQSILNHSEARNQFSEFFTRPNTFTFGICNGCQMLADLKCLIPGTEHWPAFKKNRSEQFESRLVMVKIEESPSIFLKGMAGSYLPVAVAHGEGRAEFSNLNDLTQIKNNNQIALRYVNNNHDTTERYPFNPNGSPEGITGLTTPDGRVLIVMPHPERVFRAVQNSWYPKNWQTEDSPWMQLFRNAREWIR